MLLLFTSPTCGACSLLLPEVARWQREHAEQLTVALLSDGDADSVHVRASEHGLDHVLLDERLSAFEDYRANGTPSAVLVAPDGTVASWLAAGAEWIETLVEEVLAGGAGREVGLTVGSELPTALGEHIERPTVVLFWNPGCGFCRAMHDDLRVWEAQPPDGAPGLLVVSSGTAEDVRAEGFTSPVVLDPDWTISASFGAGGTPMALLVGGDGRVASPLVAGAEDTLALMNRTSRVGVS